MEDTVVGKYSRSLNVGDLFEDDGRILVICGMTEDGFHLSKFKSEVTDEELKVLKQTLPDASKDLQSENVNQEPEQLKQNENLEELSFKELKEKAVSLGFHFKVGQGKEQLIEFIQSMQIQSQK